MYQVVVFMENMAFIWQFDLQLGEMTASRCHDHPQQRYCWTKHSLMASR